MKPIRLIPLRFVVFILTLILLWSMGRFFKINSQHIDTFLHKFSIINASLIFIILYVVVTFFIWLSKDAFRLSAAVVFGAALSTLLIFCAETINTVILFHFSRYMGRDFVEKKLLKTKISEWDQKFTRLGLGKLLLFRLVPLIPFRFLDLFLGLTNISFKKYLVAVILGSPLRIYWLQYILAGVGKSFLNNPSYLIQYLLTHRIAFWSSFVYLVLVIIVGFKLKD